MTTHAFDDELDARGLKCPMPVVKARQQIGRLAPGKVLRVLATDRGSVKDFQGWAAVAKDIELIGQETVAENGRDVYMHYLKKAG